MCELYFPFTTIASSAIPMRICSLFAFFILIVATVRIFELTSCYFVKRIEEKKLFYHPKSHGKSVPIAGQQEEFVTSERSSMQAAVVCTNSGAAILISRFSPS